MSATEAVRQRVDASLRGFLGRVRTEMQQHHPEALPLLEEVASVVDAGGKRLRPLFCFWGYRAAGGADDDAIVDAAAALELLHTFALIHDDIMDRSPLRRGRPATHEAFGGGHFGTSAAILAGDLAFVLADRLLHESGFDARHLMPAVDSFTQMRIEVIAGQHADLVASRERIGDEARARRIAVLKSGAYTVEKPLVIGALLAGCSKEIIASLRAFGLPLGEAFQLRDDVLGAMGDPAVTGKDVEADLREGKATVLVAKALAFANDDERKLLESRLGTDDMSSDDAQAIREVLVRSGAVAATDTLVDELRKQALEALDTASIDPAAAAALRELTDRAVDRDW